MLEHHRDNLLFKINQTNINVLLPKQKKLSTLLLPDHQTTSTVQSPLSLGTIFWEIETRSKCTLNIHPIWAGGFGTVHTVGIDSHPASGNIDS